jgi:hypothetical protein
MVKWEDAAGSATWRTERSAKRFPTSTCTTVGWMMTNDKRRVVIAGEVNTNHDVSNVTAIPAGWVRSIRPLKPGRVIE